MWRVDGLVSSGSGWLCLEGWVWRGVSGGVRLKRWWVCRGGESGWVGLEGMGLEVDLQVCLEG